MDSLLPIYDFVHIALLFLFFLASSLLFKNRPNISAAATASSSDESILFVFVLLVPVCVMCHGHWYQLTGTSDRQLSTGTSRWYQKLVGVASALRSAFMQAALFGIRFAVHPYSTSTISIYTTGTVCCESTNSVILVITSETL